MVGCGSQVVLSIGADSGAQPDFNLKETDNMKKLLVVLMALTLLVGVSFEVFADANIVSYSGGLSMGKLRSVSLINSSTAGYDVTSISSTYIAPGKCEILGYTANALAGTMIEGVFSVRDASATSRLTTDTDAVIFAENEVTTAFPNASVMFPASLNIVNGITVQQGPSTVVSIYYIQVRP